MAGMSSSPSSGADLLRRILRQHRTTLVFSALLLSCWTAGEALVPGVVGATIDTAIATPDAGRLALWLGALVLTFVMLSYGYRFGARISNVVVQKETHRLRTLVADRALDARGTITPRPAGEVAALASSDADVAAGVVRQFVFGVSAALGLLVCAGYLLLTQLWLGLLVLALVPLGLLALRLLTPTLTRRTGEHQEQVAAASASVADLLHGAPVLRGIGAEAEAARWFALRSQAAASAAIRAAGPAGRLDAFSTVVSGLVLAAVAGVGGWLVVEGRLSPGDLIGILGVTAFLATPISTLTALAEGWARSRASAQRLETFLREEPARRGTERPTPDPAAPLRLGWSPVAVAADERGATAAPASPDAPGTVRAAGGRFTAIVCADAGLPSRWDESFHAADGRATVSVAGAVWDAVDPTHAPAILQASPHTPHFFLGTVHHNVSHGEDVDPSVWDAAGSSELIAGWEQGQRHGLDEGGGNLSGGQRQRLALARALASPPVPRILVDPTTAVDSVTQARIAEGLLAWRRGRGCGDTLALFTSSPALAGAADDVAFVPHHGATIYGRHHDLMQRDDYREAVGR